MSRPDMQHEKDALLLLRQFPQAANELTVEALSEWRRLATDVASDAPGGLAEIVEGFALLARTLTRIIAEQQSASAGSVLDELYAALVARDVEADRRNRGEA